MDRPLTLVQGLVGCRCLYLVEPSLRRRRAIRGGQPLSRGSLLGSISVSTGNSVARRFTAFTSSYGASVCSRSMSSMALSTTQPMYIDHLGGLSDGWAE